MVDSNVASVGKLLVIRGRKRVRINHSTVRKIIQEFFLEHSSNTILSRVSISRYMLLRILTLVRMVMVQNVFQKSKKRMTRRKKLLEFKNC
jgi:hypothetical protein